MDSSFLDSVSAITDSYRSTIAALQAENARLKLQNESLEIRLADAHDRNRLLQQSLEGETHMRRTAEALLQKNIEELRKAEQFAAFCKENWHDVAGRNSFLKSELMRRGADDPDALKPPQETVFAALQMVSKWDRDEAFADLRKQRLENLRRIDVLRRGKELMMDDVVAGMNEDGARMMAEFDGSLTYVLRELREQLQVIADSLPTERMHDEWFKFPLSMFRLDYDLGMEESDSGMEE